MVIVIIVIAVKTIVVDWQEVLAELVKDKSMDAFRGEYEKLFNTLEKSNRNEKRLRTKCKELGSEIAQHVAKVDLTNDKAKEDQDTIESLKKEIEKAWKMVDTAQEGEERARETIETLNTEIQNLTKVIEEKTLGAEDTNINELRKLRDELTQQRDNLQLEVAELKTKFEANEAKVEALTKEKADQVTIIIASYDYLQTFGQEREIGELNQEAQSRNNEMNREMRRKERAERELKQLKGDHLDIFVFPDLLLIERRHFIERARAQRAVGGEDEAERDDRAGDVSYVCRNKIFKIENCSWREVGESRRSWVPAWKQTSRL